MHKTQIEYLGLALSFHQQISFPICVGFPSFALAVAVSREPVFDFNVNIFAHCFIVLLSVHSIYVVLYFFSVMLFLNMVSNDVNKVK